VIHRNTMRARILTALLGLSVIALVGFTAVAMRGFWSLGRLAISRDASLGTAAIKACSRTLDEMMRADLRALATDQAKILDEELAKIEDSTGELAESIELSWDDPKALPSLPSYGTDARPPDPTGTSVYYRSPAGTADGDALVPSSLDALLAPVARENPNIDVVEVGTAAGSLRALPWMDHLTPPVGRDAYDPRERPWYRRAMEKGSAGWTMPYLSAGSAALQLTYSVPLRHDGKIVAVLGIALDLDKVIRTRLATQLGSSGEAILVDRDFHLVARKGFTPRGLIVNGDDAIVPVAFVVDDLEALTAQVGKKNTEAVETKENGERVLLSPAAVERVPLIVLLEQRAGQVLDPVAERTSEAIKKSTTAVQARVREERRDATIELGLIFALVLLAVIWVAMRMARGITAPLTRLEAGARRMGAGDLSDRVEVRSGDEIESLAATLNKMAEDLLTRMRALKETTALQERIESELRVARDIQAGLMPRTFPPFPDRPEFDLAATMIPAREVGGDLYDFFFVDDRRLCFLVGDVSDKSVPAALYMMVAKFLFQMEARTTRAPGEILERANKTLAADNEKCMFITVFCAILDTQTGDLLTASAGHNPPVLMAAGAAPRLFTEVPRGFVVGPLEDSRYQTFTTKLGKGDRILLYTDGVTEAIDPEGALYGESRLLELATKRASATAQELVDGLRDDVNRFARGAAQADDITILALRYDGPR
jgi:sigma-B regulation protein RsbU (phosphoserine phosphatase)